MKTYIPVAILAILIVWFLALPMVGFHLQVGTGSHRGIVTAVNTHGLIFSTTDVYFKTSSESTQEDVYCLDNSRVPEFKKYMESGKEINLLYKKYILNGFAHCSGSYEVIY